MAPVGTRVARPAHARFGQLSIITHRAPPSANLEPRGSSRGDGHHTWPTVPEAATFRADQGHSQRLERRCVQAAGFQERPLVAPPRGPGERAGTPEGRVRMAGAPEQVVQHLVANHHLVRGPILGQVDVVVRLPMAGASPTRALEPVAGHHRPLNSIEVPAQARTRLRLRPPLAIDGGWRHGRVLAWVETAGGEEGEEQEHRAGPEGAEAGHTGPGGNRRAVERPLAKLMRHNTRGAPRGCVSRPALSTCEAG